MKISNKNRKIHLDLLRILAAFFVIYNHTIGYHYYLNHTNEPMKLIANIALSSFTKINVPLFFMLSGALLLQKEESYKVLFQKRILRFVLVLLLGSALMYGSTYFLYGHALNLTWFLRALLSCEISEPYWFLYVYLSFLLALPFLRKMVKQLTKMDVLMLIGFRLVFSSLMGMYHYVSSYLGYESFGLYEGFGLAFSMMDALFYPIVGFYLEHYVVDSRIRMKETVLLLSTIVCGTGISTALTYHQGTYWTGFTQDYLGLFSSTTAISVYLLVKHFCGKVKSHAGCFCMSRFAGQFSGLTLGIYLLDPLFKSVVAGRFFAAVEESFFMFPLSLVYCFVSMAVCGTITWGMKKIPGIKEIL